MAPAAQDDDWHAKYMASEEARQKLRYTVVSETLVGIVWGRGLGWQKTP